MSGTIETPATIMGTDIVDNGAGAITAGRVRNLAESAFAIVLSSNTVTGTTTSYTAQLADRGCVVTFNTTGTSPVYVIPSGTFAVGTVLGMMWLGGNQPAFSAGTGTTIHPNAGTGNTIRAQWCVGHVWQYATNAWVTMGDMSP